MKKLVIEVFAHDKLPIEEIEHCADFAFGDIGSIYEYKTVEHEGLQAEQIAARADDIDIIFIDDKKYFVANADLNNREDPIFYCLDCDGNERNFTASSLEFIPKVRLYGICKLEGI